MPSPLKRSLPGRLGRLLAALRPPSRAGPLPVQTGFPTSLADLVVKNHGRLRRRRATPLPPPLATAAEVETPRQPRRDVSPKGGGAGGFGLRRPELLALGAAVALTLLVVWSKVLVAAVTVASLALFWIESVRPAPSIPRSPSSASSELLDLCGRGRVSPIRPAPRRLGASSETEELLNLGRGRVSPIREVEAVETDSPRLSTADSDKATSELDDVGGDSRSSTPKRRSLRKLIAKRLRTSKKKPKEQVAVVEVVGGDAEPATLPPVASTATEQELTPSELTTVSSIEEAAAADGQRGGGGGGGGGALLPLAAVVLIGLVAGKLPAVALTVLCAVFFSSVEKSITS